MTEEIHEESSFLELDLDDYCRPFFVEELDVRGRVVMFSTLLDTLLQQHHYPSLVCHLLGEAITLTTLLGSALKFEGRFLLQTQSDGPLSLMVVDFTTPNKIRAMARFDEKRLKALQEKKQTSFKDLLGHGHLAMTIDQGHHMKDQQGIVALEGDSLSDVAHHYFMQSEQIPTSIKLAVGQIQQKDDKDHSWHWRAGGILAQFLPENLERLPSMDITGGDHPLAEDPKLFSDVDDAWHETESLMATLSDDELLDPLVGAERLLYRLFHERGVRVYDALTLEHFCTCSREKLLDVIGQFDEAERRSMIKNDVIEATCDFCSRRYIFKESDFSS